MTYEGDLVRPLGLVTLNFGYAEYEIDAFLQRLSDAGRLPGSWSQRPIGQKLSLMTESFETSQPEIRAALEVLLAEVHRLLEQRNTLVHGCILTAGRIASGRAGIKEKRISVEELNALAESIFNWKERLSVFRWKQVEPLLTSEMGTNSAVGESTGDPDSTVIRLEVPQVFDLQLADDGSYALSAQSAGCKFGAPASTRGVAKLYTVAHEGALLYVGIAEQPMSGRLNYGIRAAGKGGYHGYKWKGLRHPVELAVWTGFTAGERTTVRDMETIEAEVAFLCRQLSGQWPKYQHEIHFYPSRKTHRDAARSIYSHAIQRDK